MAAISQATKAKVVPLESLKAGQLGTITDALGCESTVKCLEERGLRVGSLIKVIVPGASAVVQVGDLTLSIRVCGNCQVLVRLDD